MMTSLPLLFPSPLVGDHALVPGAPTPRSLRVATPLSRTRLVRGWWCLWPRRRCRRRAQHRPRPSSSLGVATSHGRPNSPRSPPPNPAGHIRPSIHLSLLARSLALRSNNDLETPRLPVPLLSGMPAWSRMAWCLSVALAPLALQSRGPFPFGSSQVTMRPVRRAPAAPRILRGRDSLGRTRLVRGPAVPLAGASLYSPPLPHCRVALAWRRLSRWSPLSAPSVEFRITTLV
ncbi:hypothetical protein DFH94DRAFT_777235, partial [Russula ochroleuca]